LIHRSGPAHVELRVLPLDRTISAPADQPLLDAALGDGLTLTHSCRMGYCGSCRARLLSGSIVYPSGRVISAPFGSAEEGQIMLCMARPLSDVEVEPLFTPSP
jgi:CDP-4-dehydro-6-deoxyglucose reductase